MKEKTYTAKNLNCLCEAAIFVALATVFALLRFPPFRIDLWIFGGSIDFVMLPLFIMCWRIPARYSVPACFIFGIIKFLITGDSIAQYGGFVAVLLDYVIAYGAVGASAFLRNIKGGFFAGIFAGSIARFAVHFISGITIWKIAFGDTYSLFGMDFGADSGWLYSLLYNGSYMLGELVFCLILGAVLYIPLKKLPKLK